MQCDNCNAPLNFGQREYLDRKENLGTVLCYACRHGSDNRTEAEPIY